MIATYITFMFWFQVLMLVIVLSNVVKDHPRQQKPVNIGTDIVALLLSAGMLAWVSYLKFFAMVG